MRQLSHSYADSFSKNAGWNSEKRFRHEIKWEYVWWWFWSNAAPRALVMGSNGKPKRMEISGSGWNVRVSNKAGQQRQMRLVRTYRYDDDCICVTLEGTDWKTMEILWREMPDGKIVDKNGFIVTITQWDNRDKDIARGDVARVRTVSAEQARKVVDELMDRVNAWKMALWDVARRVEQIIREWKPGSGEIARAFHRRIQGMQQKKAA